MCGICFVLRRNSTGEDEYLNKLYPLLEQANAARGPDAQRTREVRADSLDLDFYSSELRLRGDAPVVQPHEGEGNILCWNGEIFDGLKMSATENDGVKLFEALGSLTSVEEVSALFSTLEGPYAFVYYQHRTRCIIYGRDPLGRRSLLVHAPSKKHPYFILASTSAGAHLEFEFKELPTQGFFCLSLDELQNGHGSATLPLVNSTLPPDNLVRLDGLVSDLPPYLAEAADGLLHHLEDSVRRRVYDIPSPPTAGSARLGVLFSGGIDCTVLALLADKYTPPEEPIDLLNVAFENPRKMSAGVDQNAKKGSKAKPNKPTAPPSQRPAYMVPDRVTGLEEVEELRRLRPRRIWNFVEVNVPFEETQATRATIEAIMYPCRTVMDLSLAQALYFAARGVGQIRAQKDVKPQPYTSRARVLLNGLGSDELLGGYGRHRTAYNAGGWTALIRELQLELDRLPTRNLGRDDRIISAHGKEARHPFLSLDVVRFLAALPVHAKTNPRLGQGLGDKLLLRIVAWRLGLVEASTRPKRAMQFGSHSARMQVDSAKKGDLLLD
ncbi:asparagine synthase-domain-containing protein [Schizophyllum commune]